MLRGREHRGGAERGSLETGDGRRRQRVPDGWILPIAFISPPPAVVARHANTGCERPADARPEHLLAGEAPPPLTKPPAPPPPPPPVFRQMHTPDTVLF